MREAVIVDVRRTPVGRRKGMLRDSHPVDLLGFLLRNVIEANPLDAAHVDDVIIGCVDQVGEQAANIGRNAWLSAGLPESVPATTLDRQCGSSLQAVHFAAQGVLAGAYDVVIAGGVESMTRVPMLSTIQVGGTPLTENLKNRYQLPGQWFDQAIGAELIAKRWGFSRQQLDEFSYESHQKAERARRDGLFGKEILAVAGVDADGNRVRCTTDEGIRPDTTVAKIAALPPAFEGLELITAGNASQISDGATAALIMSREAADALGLRPRARFLSFAVVGVDPVSMLTGPIPATAKVLQRAGLTISDIDRFEVNEAFASVVLAWQQETGAAWDRVNVHGGAIALGHPLGATGTRLLATLVNSLEQERGRYGLVTICEGGGMANATVIERLDG